MRLKKSSGYTGWLFGLCLSVALIAPTTGLAQTPSSEGPAQKPATDKPAQKPERGAGDRITDGWITMKVHAQFLTEDALDGSDIDVDTVNNVVTLTGTVRTEAGRARALAIAKATDGVKSVNDKLRIAKDADTAKQAGRETAGAAKEAGRETAGAARQGGRRVNDGWIKSKIYSQFLTEDALENSDIDIDVAAGVVTLNGTVASAAGRTRAVAIAKATEGVKNVKDSLKVAKQ